MLLSLIYHMLYCSGSKWTRAGGRRHLDAQPTTSYCTFKDSDLLATPMPSANGRNAEQRCRFDARGLFTTALFFSSPEQQEGKEPDTNRLVFSPFNFHWGNNVNWAFLHIWKWWLYFCVPSTRWKKKKVNVLRDVSFTAGLRLFISDFGPFRWIQAETAAFLMILWIFQINYKIYWVCVLVRVCLGKRKTCVTHIVAYVWQLWNHNSKS